MTLSNSMYDKLKFLALVALPSLGTAYFAFGQLWSIGHTAEVVGTITIIDTLLGGLLQINTTRYNNSPEAFDGEMNVTGYNDLSGHPDLQIKITKDPNEVVSHKAARLKIDHKVDPQ